MSQPADRDKGAALDPRLVKALEHPIRARFLSLLADHGSLSAPEALSHLGKSPKLANLVYNVWVLADLDLIEPDGERKPRQGQPYRVTPRGKQALAAMGIPSQD